MSKTLILMQGIPGSGKSTVAKKLGGVILSTDAFWWSRGAQETYAYDATLIGVAHRWNQRRVAACMQINNPPINMIIVDNTHIRQAEADPYLNLARMFEYDVQVVRVECTPKIALMRNAQREAERQVPPQKIMQMYAEMERIIV